MKNFSYFKKKKQAISIEEGIIIKSILSVIAGHKKTGKTDKIKEIRTKRISLLIFFQSRIITTIPNTNGNIRKL
jgi:hypothetical protein